MIKEFQFRGRSLPIGTKTYVMGIMNVTPDSFSEQGRNFHLEQSLENARQMIADGVDIIDVGGESTRPGADPVDAAEEISRVVPFIENLRKFSDIPVSIDTWKSEVARAALEAGADIINDVTGFLRDPQLKNVAAEFNAGCIAMHMRGTPETMQNLENLIYNDLISDISDAFEKIIEMLKKAGISENQIMLDPGIGFSKTVEQNLELIKNQQKFRDLGYPVLLGASRKSFIGKILDRPNAQERVWGTAASVACGIVYGADVVRIHDVKEMVDVCRISDALRK